MSCPRNHKMKFFCGVLFYLIHCIFSANPSQANLDPNVAKFQKFMPNPSGHGFDDKGITGDEKFSAGAQMNRFGIPDLNNPVAKELTDLEFEYAIGGDKYTAILFYAPKMEQYEYYALHWEKAWMEMMESLKVYTSANITMARFDVSEPEHAEIVEKYKINTVNPDMILFHNGSVLTHITCNVAHHDIRQFIIAQATPSIEHFSTLSALRKWKRRKQFNQANIKLLALFNNTENEEQVKTFSEVASKLNEHIQFAYVSDKDLFKDSTKLDSVSFGDIVLLRDFDSPRVIKYTRRLTVPDVINFTELYNMQLLTNMADTDEFKVRDFLGHALKYRLLYFFKTEKLFKKHEQFLKSLAKEMRSYALVAYTIENNKDGNNFDYTFWDVPSKDPAFLYFHIKKDRKYVYSGKDAYEPETIRKFLNEVKNGVRLPKLKSESAPITNVALMKTVVSDTFKEDIYDKKDENSLVLLYEGRSPESSWFLQQLEKFAKVWRRENRLVVSKMNMDLNDLLEFGDDVQFPRICISSSKMKASNHLKTDKCITDTVQYPDMEQLMAFVQKNVEDSLQRDEKIWKRLLKEDNEIKQKLKKDNEKQSTKENPIDENEIGETKMDTDEAEKIFKEEYNKLKKKINPEEIVKMSSDNSAKNEDKKQSGEKIKDEHKDNQEKSGGLDFPGSFDGFGKADQIIQGELTSLFESTGYKLPKDFDKKLNPKELMKNFSIWNTFFFSFNILMSTLFGGDIIGGMYVIGILSFLFIIFPALFRRRKIKSMEKWLTDFYEKYEPKKISTVSTTVEAYYSLSNGFNKLKEDCVRKYVMEGENKKTK